MLITSILNNEAKRNEQMILEYQQLLETLPKGSLICRKNYYYLKYRKDGKIIDEYIGKDGPTVDELRNKLELRKHYSLMLNLLQSEMKTIKKITQINIYYNSFIFVNSCVGNDRFFFFKCMGYIRLRSTSLLNFI